MVPDLTGLEINTEMCVQCDVMSTSTRVGRGQVLALWQQEQKAPVKEGVTKEVTLQLHLEHEYDCFKKDCSQSLPLASFFHSIQFPLQCLPSPPY